MNGRLAEYAQLIIDAGVNIRNHQKLVIFCDVSHADFAHLCAQYAYARGCAEVVMHWEDEQLARLRFLSADGSVFDFFPDYEREFYLANARAGAAFLHLVSEDPASLLGVDEDRISRARGARAAALREYRELIYQNRNPWCIAALASPAWSRRVFPDKTDADALSALWDGIFAANRVDGNGSAGLNWKNHLSLLAEKMDALNRLRLVSLHYKNSLGTDLTIRLCRDHVWESGGDVTVDGQEYLPNMPTEEVFTAPDRLSADGVVCVSMPLCLDGHVIRDIRFVLKDGKIIEAHASEGEELLTRTLSLDEGASYLGEIALVPYDSPIRTTGILFYKTLFDENAACHFAFGSAYPSSMRGAVDMSPDERKKAGLNVSATHVDFMVGTSDLSVTGKTPAGETVQILKNGSFVI